MSSVVIAGNDSGTITLQAPAASGSSVLTMPVATDTLVGKNTVDTLTNKTIVTPVLTVNAINGGQLAGFRNRIINGSMQIAQRGSGITVPSTYTQNKFTADRWLVACGVAQVTVNTLTAAFGTAQSMSIVNGASAQNVHVYQRIEADNCYDMAGKTVTFTAELAASSAPTSYQMSVYRAVTKDTWGTYGETTSVLVSTQTVTLSANIASAQFAIPASGNLGLEVVIGFIGLPASATAHVGRTQLEIGSVATPFEQRPYGMELALCQRYYEKSCTGSFPATSGEGSLVFAIASGTALIYTNASFAVTKRTSPTSVRIASYTGTLGKVSPVDNSTDVAGTTLGNIRYNDSHIVSIVLTAGLTASAYYWYQWEASAEL